MGNRFENSFVGDEETKSEEYPFGSQGTSEKLSLDNFAESMQNQDDA